MSTTRPSTDRLARFRSFAARLDPAGDPAHAFSEGLYVTSAHSAGARIAAALAIDPTSSHLLVGGVGSGKTTELLDVRDRLNRVGDTLAVYVDISRRQDIAKVVPGVVAVQVGLALGQTLVKEGEMGEESPRELYHLRNIAHGYLADPRELGDEEWPYVRVQGMLASAHDVGGDVRRILDLTEAILIQIRARTPHVVLLLDGLDRLSDMTLLERVIDKDLKALESMDLGVVLVAPLRSLYGLDRVIQDRFDHLHYQPWIDASGPGANSLLQQILRRRLPEDALNVAALEALVNASGGVLRDLVALAQLACGEAYLSGADAIGSLEAELGIDSFGRKHMQGLRPDEIDVLQRVSKTGSFVQTSENDLALLMTRRVLEYRSHGSLRYAVHPSIDPFIRSLPREKKK